jgi:hypothetical protein
MCKDTLASFEDHRNFLVHVYQGTSPEAFTDYTRFFEEVDELAKRVATATILIFGHVGEQLGTADTPYMLRAVDSFLEGAEWVEL